MQKQPGLCTQLVCLGCITGLYTWAV